MWVCVCVSVGQGFFYETRRDLKYIHIEKEVTLIWVISLHRNSTSIRNGIDVAKGFTPFKLLLSHFELCVDIRREKCETFWCWTPILIGEMLENFFFSFAIVMNWCYAMALNWWKILISWSHLENYIFSVVKRRKKREIKSKETANKLKTIRYFVRTLKRSLGKRKNFEIIYKEKIHVPVPLSVVKQFMRYSMWFYQTAFLIDFFFFLSWFFSFSWVSSSIAIN